MVVAVVDRCCCCCCSIIAVVVSVVALFLMLLLLLLLLVDSADGILFMPSQAPLDVVVDLGFVDSASWGVKI